MSDELKVLDTTLGVLEELTKLAKERKKRIEDGIAEEASRAVGAIHTSMERARPSSQAPTGYTKTRPYKEDINGVLMVFVLHRFRPGPLRAGGARCYNCMAEMDRADDLKSCPKCGGVLKGRGKTGGLAEIERVGA